MQCIYCKEDKPIYLYKKREHVIPQGFGKFATDNLILRNVVCDDCNSYFGEKIELFLCKDSFEGLERHRHGINPKKPLKKIRRIKSKVLSGPLKGLIVREKGLRENGRLDVEKELQVGFYNSVSQSYDFFEPKELVAAERLASKGYDIKEKEIIIIAEDGREYASIISLLDSLGIKLKSEERVSVGNEIIEDMEIECKITIDQTIMCPERNLT